MAVVAVAPGVALAAEGGLRLAPALTLQSLPGQGHAHLARDPAAALVPTHDPGVQTHISQTSVVYLSVDISACSFLT